MPRLLYFFRHLEAASRLRARACWRLLSRTFSSSFADAVNAAFAVRLLVLAGFVSTNDSVESLSVLERLRGFEVNVFTWCPCLRPLVAICVVLPESCGQCHSSD
jgi:hypothetical protein